MYEGQTVFSQLMRYLPLRIFRQCVARYQGDHRIKQFKCLDQFRCMAFAQLTYRESLRDIQACLRALHPKLYHMGIRGRVSKSTLADCKALGFLDTYLVFSPPPQRTGFGVCLGGPAPVFYSRAAARSTVHCRRA